MLHFKNGILYNNMVISPMPTHLRKRRDLLKTKSPSFENTTDGFINANEHIIYKHTPINTTRKCFILKKQQNYPKSFLNLIFSK